MDIEILIKDLSRPAAYPHEVQDIKIYQTHISLVFLTGSRVFKIKKPVNLGFLDFSTLEKRLQYCQEEVRLNRRLAPSIYLGVMPITFDGEHASIDGHGEIIDYAVEMVQLPEDAILERFLQSDQLSSDLIQLLAQHIAKFHAHAESTPEMARFGSIDSVAENVRENFIQTESHIEVSVSGTVYERTKSLSEQALLDHRELIEKRAATKVCNTHGDLRLDHVYFFPDKLPPDNIVIMDCIEFNERFRFADPISDITFLAMEMTFHGYTQEAEQLLGSYLDAANEQSEVTPLIPFYMAYRALVRGKVEGIKFFEREISAESKREALQRAKAYWLLALSQLERPSRRPCIIFTTGLPGSGKSTLAVELAKKAGFEVIRSDSIRKELVANEIGQTVNRLPDTYYSEAWSQRTYQECLRQAEELLFQGKRVLLDANFRREHRRLKVRELAERWSVPCVLLECRASLEMLEQRLKSREGDVSDADQTTLQVLLKEWESPGKIWQHQHLLIDTELPMEQALSQILKWLQNQNLWSETENA